MARLSVVVSVLFFVACSPTDDHTVVAVDGGTAGSSDLAGTGGVSALGGTAGISGAAGYAAAGSSGGTGGIGAGGSGAGADAGSGGDSGSGPVGDGGQDGSADPCDAIAAEFAGVVLATSATECGGGDNCAILQGLCGASGAAMSGDQWPVNAATFDQGSALRKQWADAGCNVTHGMCDDKVPPHCNCELPAFETAECKAGHCHSAP